ncbi:Pc21g17770 [Rhizoctonia solani AG-1 IB]|uniref:Pc21g17770 n=1 Tax=Thanatephorus cucumeris (strain AG1-IB / isolate 7/3/14) TaxID=1108050 RepID=A0A0B7FRZ0_THACB|nr:Pc21g17770 [Rhizoctonia solani AG-1 IB]
MPYVLNLPFMDLNSAAESVTLSAGLAFSGAVDQRQVEEACVRIPRAWPILGSKLQRNSQTSKIEAIVPDPEEARLKVTFQELNSKLTESESLYIKTKSISTQSLKMNQALYREHPLKNVEHYLLTGEPAFSLHITYLSDATIITLTIVHILMDASGFTEFAKAFVHILDGEPVPPVLPHDPWSILLPRALELPGNPDASLGWKIWGAEQGIASRDAESKAFEADGPIEQRIIYFPASEIARLKNEALAELELAGTPVPFLSTSDIVSAWLYKHTFIDGNEPEEETRFIYVVDARNRFREAFTPGHAYLQNAFFNMSTRRLKSTEVHSKSLGELAYLIRTSVRKQTAPDQLLAQLKWKHDHAGQTQVPFSPGEGMQFTSSWLSFGLGDLSIRKHIKPGTGNGQVLDVVYDVIGSARNTSAIKFKDVDGGIVCEVAWGAQRWISGAMAKYALERQT